MIDATGRLVVDGVLLVGAIVFGVWCLFTFAHILVLWGLWWSAERIQRLWNRHRITEATLAAMEESGAGGDLVVDGMGIGYRIDTGLEEEEFPEEM